MTRYDILFGQNYTDLSFAGINGEVISQMKCDISLDGDKLETLLTEHDGNSYMLYDVQDLIPRGEEIAMPIFKNGVMVYNDFVKQLNLKYYNANKSQTLSKKIIPGGAVIGYKWTGLYGQFLTKQPILKKTTFQSTEWLWYFLNYNLNVGSLMLKIALKTAGQTTIIKSKPIDGYLNDKLICLDVSPEYISTLFDEVEKKYISSYEIWLENNDLRISEKREYYLMNSSVYDVHLLLQNSFTVWDTISLTAGQKNSKEFDLQMSENRRKIRLDSADWFDKYSLTITDLEQGWLKYLIELIVSRKIYLRENSELVPIVCLTKNYEDFYNTKVADEATLEFRGVGFERSVKV